MPGPLEPVAVGNWYRMPDELLFEVVAFDPDQEVIEIQYFDGSLGEFDFDTWTSLLLEEVAPPEDFSGALDMEQADYTLDGDAVQPAYRRDPTSLLDTL